jgi:hypothetical protein
VKWWPGGSGTVSFTILPGSDGSQIRSWRHQAAPLNWRGQRVGERMTVQVAVAQDDALVTVEEQLVKSRHRVKTYGEVLTPRHMVDRMLDLVREELESGPNFVDKTFLEPAAGDGNFLIAILERKLAAIEKSYPYEEWPETSLFALASIYGIELLEDNHRDAKDAMLDTFVRFHDEREVPCGPETALRRSAAFLIDANIVRGDTLTGLDWRGAEIEFSWWHRLSDGTGVQRESFTFSSLRDNAFDFTPRNNYEPCRIDGVHEQGEVSSA